MSSTIRAALRPIDPTLPTIDVRQMQQLVDHAVSPRRFIMWLLTAFAGQALILACLGIYGVIVVLGHRTYPRDRYSDGARRLA